MAKFMVAFTWFFAGLGLIDLWRSIERGDTWGLVVAIFCVCIMISCGVYWVAYAQREGDNQ